MKNQIITNGHDVHKVNTTSQKERVFQAFQTPKTMLQVAIETHVLRANICWYVRIWRKSERIAVVKKGLCPISKCRATFWSTNADDVERFNLMTYGYKAEL